MTTAEITKTAETAPETVTITLPARHHLPDSTTPLTKDGIAEDMITFLSAAVGELGNLCMEHFMSLDTPENWNYSYRAISNRVVVLYHHLDMIQNFLSAAYNMPDQYFRDQLETLILPGE